MCVCVYISTWKQTVCKISIENTASLIIIATLIIHNEIKCLI